MFVSSTALTSGVGDVVECFMKLDSSEKLHQSHSMFARSVFRQFIKLLYMVTTYS